MPRCPVSRCQFPQFWWSRDVTSRVFSRPKRHTSAKIFLYIMQSFIRYCLKPGKAKHGLDKCQNGYILFGSTPMTGVPVYLTGDDNCSCLLHVFICDWWFSVLCIWYGPLWCFSGTSCYYVSSVAWSNIHQCNVPRHRSIHRFLLHLSHPLHWRSAVKRRHTGVRRDVAVWPAAELRHHDNHNDNIVTRCHLHFTTR